ncbi:IS701 family transposase [Streptomyces sp. NPDC090036]|uniref:IS701 family transposase n=1 Tax=Streptomyces sp. NPDC090036 TaxID=3365926 RepID=UPI0038192B50
MGSQLVQFTRSQTGLTALDHVGQLCQTLFDPLPRADQRRKAELYVRGLLTARGRKTMRNIAAHAGMPAGEQSLHHFISCSTWDWDSVRENLAVQLDGMLKLQAWVVKPMVIPKSGAHSVGVERRFDPETGHVVNGQQAYGAWAASEEASVPVSWALHLPEETTLADCAARAVLDIARTRAVRRLPVVVDAVEGGAELITGWLGAAEMPFMVEVSAATPLHVTDPQLPRGAGKPVTAGQIMDAAGMLRRPVRYEDRADRTVRLGFLATLQVELPESAGAGAGGAAGVRRRPAGRGPLLLVGEWSDARRRPERYWLTDMTGAPPAVLMRLGQLSRRIERGATDLSDRVGMRDFEGRSYQGWHRHVTLASVAQATAAMAAVAAERMSSGYGPGYGHGYGHGSGHAYGQRPGHGGGFGDAATGFGGFGGYAAADRRTGFADRGYAGRRRTA